MMSSMHAMMQSLELATGGSRLMTHEEMTAQHPSARKRTAFRVNKSMMSRCTFLILCRFGSGSMQKP